MRNNNNDAPFGVIREIRITRPTAGAVAGAGFGGAPAGGVAGAGFGGAQVGGGAVAGFGGAPAGGAAGAGAVANNDRPVTPPGQIFQFPAVGGPPIYTPPTRNVIAQPQVPVVQNQVPAQPNQVAAQPNQVAAQPIVDQIYLVNGINTPPPSPRGNQ